MTTINEQKLTRKLFQKNQQMFAPIGGQLQGFETNCFRSVTVTHDLLDHFGDHEPKKKNQNQAKRKNTQKTHILVQKKTPRRVMINATGCPAPVLDRNRMNTHKHLSQLIASAVDHDIPTPV